METLAFTGSKAAYRSELNYQLPPTDLSVEHTCYQTIFPQQALTDDLTAPIEFHYQASNYYLDLRNSLLYTKCKIVKADGTALEAGKNYATINCPATSLFSDVCVYLSQNQTCESHGLYGVESIFKMMTSPEISETDKQGALFSHEDKPGTANDTNESYKQRKKLFAQSTSVELACPLLVDIFSAKHYLPAGISLSVKLQRAANEFVLWTSETTPSCKLVIQECKLILCKKAINSLITSEHEKLLKSTGIRIPYTKHEVRKYSLQSGSQNINTINLFKGDLPHKALIAFVKTSALNGSLATNPYEFKPFKIENLTLGIDNNVSLNQLYNVDFSNQNSLLAYRELYREQLPAPRQSYCDGDSVIFAFDINQTVVDNGLSPYAQGSISLTGNFKEPLDDAITMLVCGIYTNILHIDEHRNVTVHTS